MKRSRLCGLLLCLIVFGCEEVLERSLEGKKVVLQAPANNLSTTDSAHLFYWDEMEGALEYQLQIVTPRFDSIVRLIEDSTMNGVTFDTELEPGTYQWRVRALNNSTRSDYSDAWNLTIQ
jgi:hypothetical protein